MRYTLFVLLCLVAAPSWGADWITAPSQFTNDPRTGERVNQYTPIGPVYSYNNRSDYRTSGFRYTQDSMQFGRNSFDRLHLVEEWGAPVRPYGEWEFPFRPFSVPYSQWGPPFAGLGGGWGWGGPWLGPGGPWRPGPWQGGGGPWQGGGGGGPGPGWPTRPSGPGNHWPGQGGWNGGGGGWNGGNWNGGNWNGGGPGGGNPPSAPLNNGSWDQPPQSGIGGT